MVTPTRSVVLPFSIAEDGSAARYGEWFWAVGLPDGREAMCYADRVEITAQGALLLWRETELANPDTFERTPLPGSRLMLALAPGGWLTVYAASVLDGSPVAIEHLPAPSGNGRKPGP